MFALFVPQPAVPTLGKRLMKTRFLRLVFLLLFIGTWASAQSIVAPAAGGSIIGIVKDQLGNPLAGAVITATKLDDSTTRTTVSGADGTYRILEVVPAMYSVMAEKEGFSQVVVSSLAVVAGKDATADFMLVPPPNGPATNVARGGFWKRFAQAYADDWHETGAGGPEPKYRGYPAPMTNPPWPFTVWPYGGSPVIGQPNTNQPALMTALYNGPNGEKWQDSKIQIYGWIDTGFNISSSNKGEFANAPAAYYIKPNAIELDQAAIYFERVPDTVQTDHFDWGFRFTTIYGEDYRYTTSKGVFSNQLLGKNQLTGVDPVMLYLDLYFPHIASGMNVRIGRYVSLPDIEAQLAPNNYTFSHSLLYVYDCYTQEGIKSPPRRSAKAGCSRLDSPPDATPRSGRRTRSRRDRSASITRGGSVRIRFTAAPIRSTAASTPTTTCRRTISPGITRSTATGTSIPRAGINTSETFRVYSGLCRLRTAPTEPGARMGEQQCYAPEWAILNYVERQIGKHNTLSFRNEYFDDIKGQRTGYQTKYTEHEVAWNHWIGSSIVFRPEIRFEHSYLRPAYDDGTKKNQLIFAGDMIFFY